MMFGEVMSMSARSEEIGKRIKAARKEKKLSQTELANILGKTLRSVQKYESGEIEPSIALLNTIANVLSVSPAALIGYQSQSIRLDSLSDVFHVLNELNKKAGLHFEIEVKRPPQYEGWSCSMRFNGKQTDAPYNEDICLFLERYADACEDLANYQTDQAYFDQWMETELAYYANTHLEDRPVETLTTEERIRRRNELDRQRMEQQQADEQ